MFSRISNSESTNIFKRILMVFFFNCRNWEKCVEKIGISIDKFDIHKYCVKMQGHKSNPPENISNLRALWLFQVQNSIHCTKAIRPFNLHPKKWFEGYPVKSTLFISGRQKHLRFSRAWHPFFSDSPYETQLFLRLLP